MSVDSTTTIVWHNEGYKILFFYSQEGKLLESWWSNAKPYKDLTPFLRPAKIERVENELSLRLYDRHNHTLLLTSGC